PEFGNFVEVNENGQDRNLNIFLKVNQELRKQNVKEIFSHTRSSDESIYWKGSFIRLPKAARKAGFADLREYRYNRQAIDHQYHMGVDLASVSHAPVPAANNGKVVFAGSIGIYGNTIIVDHGFGLFSTYSHLNDMSVEKGQMVKKEEIIGTTGTSGLAGGDHLHFGMIVHNTFVNPVEWWDGKWIKNNITEKINSARSVPAASK
ncbi:M23 family metallopeptidase, partial [Desulfobacterales bacterium HSG16]|nr:M23 family metallopeptidase [Desulfobacterales bacterium HSG16]